MLDLGNKACTCNIPATHITLICCSVNCKGMPKLMILRRKIQS